MKDQIKTKRENTAQMQMKYSKYKSWKILGSILFLILLSVIILNYYGKLYSTYKFVLKSNCRIIEKLTRPGSELDAQISIGETNIRDIQNILGESIELDGEMIDVGYFPWQNKLSCHYTYENLEDEHFDYIEYRTIGGQLYSIIMKQEWNKLKLLDEISLSGIVAEYGEPDLVMYFDEFYMENSRSLIWPELGKRIDISLVENRDEVSEECYLYSIDVYIFQIWEFEPVSVGEFLQNKISLYGLLEINPEVLNEAREVIDNRLFMIEGFQDHYQWDETCK